jgi:hypothetical protein
MKNKSELNPRQWALYNHLKQNGDKWEYQIDIVNALSEHYHFDDSNEKFHDSGARHLLTADIRVLNNSEVIQKIIMSGAKGVKIANESEFSAYIGKEINAAVRRLMRAKRKAEKGNRDGQMRFVLNKERDTIEAFLREIG